VAELSGRELLSEWRQVMETVLSSAAAAAGRSELPSELLRATHRQLELLQEIVDSERLQGNVVDVLLGPAEAVLDVLADSGTTLRHQAEAMESAGRALQESAALMKQQAELFEKLIGLMRQPTELARAAAGAKRRTDPPATDPADG
jgi:chemotaxis protein histidine kinase CheA